MLNILLTLALTVTTINSLNCMELVSKKLGKSKSDETNLGFRKKPKLRRQKSSSLSSIDENKITKIVNPNESEHGFIKAVRNEDIAKVSSYLNISWFDPNVINIYGNTALHQVALLENSENIDSTKQENIMKLFFEEPRVDFSITNKHGRTAHELINNQNPDNTQNPRRVAVRTKFFARYILSKVTNTQALKIHNLCINDPVNDKTINDLIDEIITTIRNDRKLQDTELPIAAQLPEYATQKFIKKMLKSQLSRICNNQ